MQQKKLVRVCTILSLSMVILACGQSGPLYLPDEQPRNVPEQTNPAPAPETASPDTPTKEK